MSAVLITLGVVALILYAVPAIAVYKGIRIMSRGLDLPSLDESDCPAEYSIAKEYFSWTAANDFHNFLGGYYFGMPPGGFAAFWQHDSEPTYLLLLIVRGQRVLNFATAFDKEYGLDTVSMASEVYPAPPGHYKQTFSKLDLPQLYARHTEAARFLRTDGRLEFARTLPNSIAQAVSDDGKRQAAYVESMPLWPLRAPYWYYVRRLRLHNRTIEELHRKGLAPLPHEREFRDFSPMI